MSGIASGASAAHSAAHLGQAPGGRASTAPAADGGDDNSPFAALLDDNAPAQPTAPLAGQRLFARSGDAGAAHPVTTENGANQPRATSGSNDSQTQATSAQPSPNAQSSSDQSANAQQAPDMNKPPPAAPDATAAAVAQDDSFAGTIAANLNSPNGTTTTTTTTGSPSPRTDKKSGTKDSDAGTPALIADPSASLQPPPPPPVAAVALPVAPPASVANQNGSPDGDSSTEGADGAPDTAQIAALGGAIRAATPRGQSPNVQNAGNAGNATPTNDAPSSNKPAAPASDPTHLVPQLPDQASSQAQRAASDRVQARDGSTAGPTANDPPATDSQTDDATAPAADPSQIVDAAAGPGRDPVSKSITDVAAQGRQVDKTETAAPTLQANAPQVPNAAGATIAPTQLSTTSPQASAPTTASASPPTVPIAGLAVAIAAQAQNGNSRFDIRLDPPELGRIDVRLDVDRDGKVTSHLIADRPETLDLLRRDAPQIEKSLQQAGLKTGDDGLQFSLRDNGTSGGFNNFGGNPYPNNGSSAGANRMIIPDRDLPPVDAVAAGYGRATTGGAGVDIRV